MQNLDVFVDESGNTGDAIDPTGEFGGQPCFTLVGVGEPTGSGLIRDVLARMKAKHKVRSAEPKARISKRKPDFVPDLVAELARAGCPIFVEVMDKHFFLCATMVNHFFGIVEQPLAVLVADILATFFPASYLAPYADFAKAPGKGSFDAFVPLLLARLELAARLTNPQVSIHFRGLAHIVQGIVDAGFLARDYVAYEHFLPPPDRGPSGAYYAMLPHVSAFYNLYARTNLCAVDLESLVLIHDEQRHYDTIIQQSASSLESNQYLDFLKEVPSSQQANYDFSEAKVSLAFSRSENAPGIQVADLLARALNQRMTWVIRGEAGDSPSAGPGLDIRTLTAPGTGMNIVSTWHRCERFYDA